VSSFCLTLYFSNAKYQEAGRGGPRRRGPHAMAQWVIRPCMLVEQSSLLLSWRIFLSEAKRARWFHLDVYHRRDRICDFSGSSVKNLCVFGRQVMTHGTTFAIGRIHYLNCKGSQVGQSSTPLPPSEWEPFITYPDRMRKDQTLYPLPTKDFRDEEVPRVLQLLLPINVLCLQRYSAWGLYRRPTAQCLPWMSCFHRDDTIPS